MKQSKENNQKSSRIEFQAKWCGHMKRTERQNAQRNTQNGDGRKQTKRQIRREMDERMEKKVRRENNWNWREREKEQRRVEDSLPPCLPNIGQMKGIQNKRERHVLEADPAGC